MKTTHITASKDGPAHWLIEPEADTGTITTLQGVDRSGVEVVTVGPSGVDRENISKGLGSVAIVLPVGQWRVERSDDGEKWGDVTTLNSVDNPPYGPSQRVNIILDGAECPVLWGRYTRQLVSKTGQSATRKAPPPPPPARARVKPKPKTKPLPPPPYRKLPVPPPTKTRRRW